MCFYTWKNFFPRIVLWNVPYSTVSCQNWDMSRITQCSCDCFILEQGVTFYASGCRHVQWRTLYPFGADSINHQVQPSMCWVKYVSCSLHWQLIEVYYQQLMFKEVNFFYFYQAGGAVRGDWMVFKWKKHFFPPTRPSTSNNISSQCSV